jgi:hypothetical protein
MRGALCSSSSIRFSAIDFTAPFNRKHLSHQFMKTKPCNAMLEVSRTGIFLSKFLPSLPTPKGRGNGNSQLGTVLVLLVFLSTFNLELSTFAQGTAFTYQGRLADGGAPANSNYDMQFYLRDAASNGNPVGTTNTLAPVPTSNGLFTVVLDFGAGIFTGNALWLEIGVRTNGSVSPYTTLSPRQPLTPSPYAIMANSASNLLGPLPAAQLSGTIANGQLVNNSLTISTGPGLSGGGTVALGGSTTLTNAGVLSVSGNADITASIVNGAVTLGNTATTADTPATIVKRDGQGNFSARSINLEGTLTLPTTTSSNGVIYSGFFTLIHSYGSENFFSGAGAGNLTMTGQANTGLGFQALGGNTSGYQNTAIGAGVLEFNTTGGGNTASGSGALFANTSGSENTASGVRALTANLTGIGNTASGYFTLQANTNGNDNVANGFEALYNNTSGQRNTANGFSALYSQTTGINNTADGAYALYFNTSGQNNVALGYQAGQNPTNGSFNIEIGNSGLSTDSNLIRIGQGTQTNTFIAGIFGAAVASSSPVFVTSAGQLGTGGTVPASAIADGSIPNGKLVNSSITINAGTGLTGGGTVSLGGSTTLNNSGVLSVTGNSDITASTVNGAVTLGDTATSANSGSAIIKRDAGGGFSAGSVTLSGNLNLPATTGTAGVITSGGSTLVHAFGVGNLFAGTSAGNLTLSGSDNTASGFHALTANTSGSQNTACGSGALAANTTGLNNVASGYQALASNISGGVNTASGSQALFSNTSGIENSAHGFQALLSNTNGAYNTADGAYALNGNTSGNNNCALGYKALNSNISANNNTACGYEALFGSTTGSNNTAAGFQVLFGNSFGSQNTASGFQALFLNANGSNNTASGYQALYNNVSGNYNLALGYAAGTNITGSSNICIAHPGVAGNNNTIRIGTGQTNTFVAGISGATVSGSTVVVSSSGQLGVAASSRRFKQDVKDMANASDALLALRPVTFRYKPNIDPSGTPQFGLIAEEVDKVDPDLVVRGSDHGIYSVRYEAVNAMLLNEFLKQHRKLEAQAAELARLKAQAAEVEGLKTRLEKLEQLFTTR